MYTDVFQLEIYIMLPVLEALIFVNEHVQLSRYVSSVLALSTYVFLV